MYIHNTACNYGVKKPIDCEEYQYYVAMANWLHNIDILPIDCEEYQYYVTSLPSLEGCIAIYLPDCKALVSDTNIAWNAALSVYQHTFLSTL